MRPDKINDSMPQIKLINIVGARPQIIKASAISRAIRKHFSEKSLKLLFIPGSIMIRRCLRFFLMNLKFINLIIIWVSVLQVMDDRLQ